MKLPNITPGPWATNFNTCEQRGYGYIDIYIETPDDAKHFNITAFGTGYDETGADALAIAAVPEFLALAALIYDEECLHYYPDTCPHGMAKAALLKAGATE